MAFIELVLFVNARRLWLSVILGHRCRSQALARACSSRSICSIKLFGRISVQFSSM